MSSKSLFLGLFLKCTSHREFLLGCLSQMSYNKNTFVYVGGLIEGISNFYQ